MQVRSMKLLPVVVIGESDAMLSIHMRDVVIMQLIDDVVVARFAHCVHVSSSTVMHAHRAAGLVRSIAARTRIWLCACLSVLACSPRVVSIVPRRTPLVGESGRQPVAAGTRPIDHGTGCGCMHACAAGSGRAGRPMAVHARVRRA